ncbi:hypothetical protein Fmac_006726 [Flemingia macrophylla]|uniref:Pectinesterase inhibitor domain-containing protein n=1 Tax=Flemingia macrophylla TaxID=520843 RepID=A0ABD1NBE9_9FABA
MYNPLSRRKQPLPMLIFHVTPIFLLLLSSLTTAKATTTTTLHVHVANSTCEGTLYPHLCVSTLSSFPDLTSKTLPQTICSLINHTIQEVTLSSSNCTALRRRLPALTTLDRRALDDCLALFDGALAELKTTIADLSKAPTIGSQRYHHSQTLLSAAMTNLYTCLDGFAYSKGHVRDRIQKGLFRISHHVSNSLAMLKKVKKPSEKNEAFPEYGEVKEGFPSWVSPKDRKLLQSAVNETKFDLVVAKDGTGNFTTIGEALAAAPNSSTTRQICDIHKSRGIL